VTAASDHRFRHHAAVLFAGGMGFDAVDETCRPCEMPVAQGGEKTAARIYGFIRPFCCL
jgi:hypothetical protein